MKEATSVCQICGEVLFVYKDKNFCGKLMGRCSRHGIMPLDQQAIECPDCKQQTLFKYQYKLGLFKKVSSWVCAHCEAEFSDLNDAPDRKIGSRCYKCNGDLGLLKDNKYWKCRDCNSFYRNVEGNAEKPEQCTKCGRRQLVKILIEKANNAETWLCNHCKRHFDSDKETELKV